MASTLSEVVITASLNLGRFTAKVVSGEQLGFLAVLGSILEDLIDQADAVADSNYYAKEGAKQAMVVRDIVVSLSNTRGISQKTKGAAGGFLITRQLGPGEPPKRSPDIRNPIAIALFPALADL